MEPRGPRFVDRSQPPGAKLEKPFSLNALCERLERL